MNKVSNILLGLLLITPSFAQNTSSGPILSEELKNLEKTLDELAQNLEGQDGKISFFIRTEDDKLIRFRSAFPNSRGTELNSRISKTLLSAGQYESEDELIPELGMKCKKSIYKLSKNNQIAMSYSVGCQRGS
jgi:plasmid maintenance system antidote protein VapI